MNKYLVAFGFGFIAYDTFIYFKTRRARNEAIEALNKSSKLNELSMRALEESKLCLTLGKITPELWGTMDDISDLTDEMMDQAESKFLS